MNLTKIGRRYHVRLKTTDGTHRTVSTKATTKEEAQRLVKEAHLEDLQAAAKAGRLATAAVGVLATGRKLTLLKAVEKYIEIVAGRREPKTVANISSTLNAWMRDMKLASLPPSGITEAHVDQWVNGTKSESKAQTRRLWLSAIRGFLDYCLDNGWMVSGNPAGRKRVQVKLRLLSHQQCEPTKRIPFTALEVKRLLKYFEDRGMAFWQFATALSWDVGLRLGDICNLEWDCFNDAGRIVVWTDKRDRRISVPLAKDTANLITLIPVSHERFVFPQERELNLDPDKRSTLSIYFKRYCERNEIMDKSFHCLRHACITRWAKEGKSLESIGKDVGHSSPEITKGYVH